jgi:hypothetical protein
MESIGRRFAMKCNVGGWDRGLRIVIGLVLIVLGLAGAVSGTTAIAAYVVGAIALLTGLVGFCGLYTVLGISTRR